LFLSVFFKIFNPSPLLASFLNILLFVMCVFSLYKIGEILFGEQVAFKTAVIFSFYPSLLIFNLLILVEPLSTFLILTGVYFFILYLKQVKPRFLILSAVFTGLSSWATEVAIFIPLVMVILILFKHIKQPKAALRAVSWIIAVYIMTLAPLSIYNYNKFGSYWLSKKTHGYFRYFILASWQKPTPAQSGSIKSYKRNRTLKKRFLWIKRNFASKKRFLRIKNYFVARRHFFGGTGTLSMLRVFGYDIANDRTSRMIRNLIRPAGFLTFIRRRAGIMWVIYQYLAWVFIVFVYLTSFLAIFILFFRKKYAEIILIILMLAYFLCAYYFRSNSRCFYALAPFLSLLCGYFISSLGRGWKDTNNENEALPG
jgi:4-amino-4-deoxy-L-arabinose transferase-like glycosyltransferase